MIKELINESQAKNSEALYKLIEIMMPLLKKFAFKLNYEDSLYDLICDYIEIINKIPIHNLVNKYEASMYAYLQKAIKSAYNKRLAYRLSQLSIITLSDFEEINVNKVKPTDRLNDLSILLYDYKKLLTKQEFDVIYKHFILDLPITEISNLYQKNRQAIYRVMNKALKSKRQKLDTYTKPMRFETIS